MTPSKPLIAVLGLGEMGVIHARNLAKVRGIRLGLASSRPEVLKQYSEILCADRTFISYDDVFRDPNVSAVVIATPPETHPNLIAEAAKNGKHVFSEKPLGYDSATVVQALKSVQHAGIRFMVGLNRRWDRDYIAAREAVEKGTLGDPLVLKCTSGDPEYPEKYQRGGAEFAMLKDLAVHDIDLARWLTRSEVDRVYVVSDALTYPALKEANDADVVVAIIHMKSGAKAMFHFSRAFHFGYDVTTELFCKNGAIQIGELKMTAMTTLKERKSSTDIAWHFGERFEGAFARQMEAFAELVLAPSAEKAQALMAGNSSYANGEDGLAATIVAEALVKSSLSGLPEKVEY